MQDIEPYKPKNHIRIVTAASLFDGHDATINVMRRILQSSGAEVIHLGHNISVQEIVDCAIQEDVQAVAITSYQGGHLEFFKYMLDLFKERGCGHIKIFGGGGGVILPKEIKELQEYGITRLYSPDDGRAMGLQGMINDMLEKCDYPCGKKIKINIKNYRDLEGEKFDKISCIGMSEHVGKKNMPDFFQTVNSSLKKGGLFIQHTITTNQKIKKGYENAFLNQYMFPGGELMFEHELVDLASSSGFELLTAENFRPHYIKTLNDWIARMEEHKGLLLKIISDKIYRIYHVFFIGSLISFRKKEISLFQNLFYKTDEKIIGTDNFISPYSKNETRIA